MYTRCSCGQWTGPEEKVNTTWQSPKQLNIIGWKMVESSKNNLLLLQVEASLFLLKQAFFGGKGAGGLSSLVSSASYLATLILLTSLPKQTCASDVRLESGSKHLRIFPLECSSSELAGRGRARSTRTMGSCCGWVCRGICLPLDRFSQLQLFLKQLLWFLRLASQGNLG